MSCPGAAWNRPRRAQGAPGIPKWPFGGPKWVPREPRERPKKGLGEAQHTTQEDTRAEKPRQEDTSGDKTTEDKTRGKTRQQTDKRSSGATKPRTPWPVSNLLLEHLMHRSTVVNIDIHTRCSKGGAKASPISRDVPSLRRSVVARCRSSDVLRFRR